MRPRRLHPVEEELALGGGEGEDHTRRSRRALAVQSLVSDVNDLSNASKILVNRSIGASAADRSSLSLCLS